MSRQMDEFELRQRHWRAEGDARRLRLLECYHDGMRFRETQPDRQFEAMTQCRDEARRLAEPWWELFFEHWRLDALAAGKHDFRQALPLAVELIGRFSTAEGRDHASQVQVMLQVLYVLAETDPFGYRSEIEQGFEAVEQQIGSDFGGDRFVLNNRRIGYFCGTERWEDAAKLAQQSLAAADRRQSRWHGAWTCFHFCRIDHAMGRWQPLAQHARLMLRQSTGDARLRRTRGDANLWIAVTHAAADDHRAGAECFEAALSDLRTLDRRDEMSADPMAAYYELLGDWEAALNVRERQLADVSQKGALHTVALVHIQRCRLLKFGNALCEGDVRQAREAAEQLREPKWYLRKLNAVT